MNTPFRCTLSVLLLAALCSCDSSPKSRIERVLAKDKQVCAEVSAFESGDKPLDEILPVFVMKVDEMTQAQKSIDLSGCPPDFVTAYIDHVRAWEDMAQVLRLRPKVPTGADAFLGGFLRGMQGDITGGLGELQGQVRAWANQVYSEQIKIRDRWRNVEDVAIRYGAQLP